MKFCPIYIGLQNQHEWKIQNHSLTFYNIQKSTFVIVSFPKLLLQVFIISVGKDVLFSILLMLAIEEEVKNHETR